MRTAMRCVAVLALCTGLAGAGRAEGTGEAGRLVDHFDRITLHANNPPPARVKAGTHLRDVFGRVLYDGAPDQLITLHGNEPMVVQLRPVVRDRRGHRMFYLRGTVGTFHVGGKPTATHYSGFVWASAVVDADLKHLQPGFDHVNAVDGAWKKELARHALGPRVVAPVEVTGVHVGKHGTARHVLRMYGYAHGTLKDFAFGCTNLLGHVAGGGQVNMVLPRGAHVEATDIVRAIPDTREGPELKFRLCTVRLGPPGDTVEVATWIATQCLESAAAAVRVAQLPAGPALLGVSSAGR